MFCWFQKSSYLCTRKNANNGCSKQPNGVKQKHNAEIAQLVEHNLAKVGVASSSLVFRSFTSKQRFIIQDLSFFERRL